MDNFMQSLKIFIEEYLPRLIINEVLQNDQMKLPVDKKSGEILIKSRTDLVDKRNIVALCFELSRWS